MNKFTKTSLIIIIIASTLMILGAYLKTQKLPIANYIMGISFVLEIVVGGMLLLHIIKIKNKYFKDKNFVPGRKVMTCCAEDTSFIGYISFYDKISSLENRQWITVTAQIAYEFQMAYKKKGPVLYV